MANAGDELLEAASRAARNSMRGDQRLAKSLVFNHGRHKRDVMARLDVDESTLERMLGSSVQTFDPGCAQHRHAGCVAITWSDEANEIVPCACECHEQRDYIVGRNDKPHV